MRVENHTWDCQHEDRGQIALELGVIEMESSFKHQRRDEQGQDQFGIKLDVERGLKSR